MQLFLSYNSVDRTSVVAVQRLLQTRGITTFLDRDNLVSGLAWPQALEQALRAVGGVAVFIGRELGGWQKREMWFALDRQVREEKEGRAFPVIPVLLQGADLMPGFLFLNTWIDLRCGLDSVVTAEALNAFERALRATGPIRDIENLATWAAEHAATICPYRGLQVFREEDAAFFAGRKAFAKQLLNFTLDKNLVVVVGPSGSGKSSVVQAGLLPLLRRQQPPAHTWDAISFTPGDDPFHRLALALIPLLEPDRSEVARLAGAEELGRNLAAKRTRLEAVISRVIEKSNGTRRLLLIADQFEELFTLTPESNRRPFAQVLLHALGSAPVTLLVTLRADFYSQMITLDRGLSDVLAPAQVNIGALTPKELWESIIAPAKLVGLEFESGLVDRILTDVGSEPGRLPLVEFALTEIWQRREGRQLTNRAYDEIGGVTGALARRAEAEFARLNPEEQKGAQRLFSRLVRVAKPEEAGEDTRQRTELSEADTLAKHVANRLADARLLVTASEPGTRTVLVEVAHEVLIRNWERLRTWLNEDREFLLWRQRLQVQARDWLEHSQDLGYLLRRGPLSEAERWLLSRPQDLTDSEQQLIRESITLREEERKEEERRRLAEIENARRLQEAAVRRSRLLWRASLALVALLLLALGAVAFAWGQRKAAKKQAQIATTQSAAAKKQAQIANEQRLVAQVARTTAEQRTLAAQQALTESFYRTIGVSAEKLPTPDEREALWELAQLDPANAAVRRNLLNRWLGTVEAFMRGNIRGGQGFRAATRLNVEYHRLTTSTVAELGRSLAAALEDRHETNHSRLWSLGRGLAALAGKMQPQAAADIAKGLAAALEEPHETDPDQEIDPDDRPSVLVEGLAALADKLEPQAAAEIAKGLAAALINWHDTADSRPSFRLWSLGRGLAALAGKMQPQAAADIAKGLAAALEDPHETDPDQRLGLSLALAALAGKVQPQAAAKIARPAAQVLALALGGTRETDPDRLSVLVEGLAALADKLEPQAAAEIAKYLAAALIDRHETDNSWLSSRLLSLGRGLAALAGKMQPQAAADIAKGLAAALKDPHETDPDRLLGLDLALAALAGKMQPQAAADIAKGLAAALEDPRKTNSNQLLNLAQGLAALAGKMQPQAAAKIATPAAGVLAMALKTTRETDPDRLSVLVEGLEALADKLEPQVAAEIAGLLLGSVHS